MMNQLKRDNAYMDGRDWMLEEFWRSDRTRADREAWRALWSNWYGFKIHAWAVGTLPAHRTKYEAEACLEGAYNWLTEECGRSQSDGI